MIIIENPLKGVFNNNHSELIETPFRGFSTNSVPNEWNPLKGDSLIRTREDFSFAKGRRPLGLAQNNRKGLRPLVNPNHKGLRPLFEGLRPSTRVYYEGLRPSLVRKIVKNRRKYFSSEKNRKKFFSEVFRKSSIEKKFLSELFSKNFGKKSKISRRSM